LVDGDFQLPRAPCRVSLSTQDCQLFSSLATSDQDNFLFVREGAVGNSLSGSGSQPKLLDRMRLALRSRHYSRRTEEAYCQWVKRFIYFHHVRHPAEMAEPEINAFLTHLAVQEKVSSSTRNQALSALLFLYRHVIGREVGRLGEVIRARKPPRLPVVMTRDEVKAVLAQLTGDKWLMASLLYGAGLRLMECLRLRVQDIDFSRNEILVRDGKGAKDRITMLPESLKAPLQGHFKKVRAVHERDLAEGWGRVLMPDALDRKYPNAPKEWRWQWVFPQENRWKNTQTAKKGGIMRMDPPCRRRSSRPSARPVSLDGQPATPSAIPLQRTCSRAATTSEPCRSYWGTTMSEPPWSTPMF
jgi:integron integrase